MTRIAHVFTSSKFVPFVLPLIVGLKARGYDVCAISADGTELALLEERGIVVHRVEMTRSITPLVDLKSLIGLTRRLREIAPDVVHSHNPKAGLVGTAAAFFAGIRPRIYHVHGSPLLTARGLKKALFWLSESASHTLAQAPLSVSPSLKSALMAARVLGAGRARVLMCGSASGIDVQMFAPKERPSDGSPIRARSSIPLDATVVGFAGRLIEEKGLWELSVAWEGLAREFPRAWLLVAGAPDGREPAAIQKLQELPRVILLGQVEDMVSFYQGIDILALPSYREGLSTVVLEALASEVPVVATRVVGTVDVIEPSVTGLLVPPRDAEALASGLRELLLDEGARKRMGSRGREFVVQSFDREKMLEALVAFYAELGFPPT